MESQASGKVAGVPGAFNLLLLAEPLSTPCLLLWASEANPRTIQLLIGPGQGEMAAGDTGQR